MPPKVRDTFTVRSDHDVVTVRQKARQLATELGFSLVNQTKLVTAVSELARNMVVWGGGGTVRMEIVKNGALQGVRLTFEDHGRGIPDIEQAMKDGYSGGSGLGLGLGGAKRLVDEFDIVSRVGKGTRVTITRWK
ncbi:MAG: anti-sigma regulatory factor [Candidatus Abyssobacteria bacterium SURF_17]|uniref:Anti-sigma regulatory factor n=1 Tax=Candidatus Abyssobacteria bacterium SURF_17 TaxID=2093361 RepID=A0A419F4R0_9BACT|nr:MAG: anti-sigma regulatory factor [Candidatus Abyssubacteria bacterium SURF_17]